MQVVEVDFFVYGDGHKGAERAKGFEEDVGTVHMIGLNPKRLESFERIQVATEGDTGCRDRDRDDRSVVEREYADYESGEKYENSKNKIMKVKCEERCSESDCSKYPIPVR